jgi:hypothetical protein
VAFTANDYIVDAAELYGDTAYDRISTATWIKYLNAAVRALILVRPDAGAVTESVQLVAGPKQTLPTAALRLLDITRNMGTDGATAGKIITPSDRKHIDYSNLLWPAGTAGTAVENYSYDNNVPRIFYVTPPVHAVTAVYVEMSTSQLPTAMTYYIRHTSVTMRALNELRLRNILIISSHCWASSCSLQGMPVLRKRSNRNGNI